MIRTLMVAGVTLGLASVSFGQDLQPRLGDPVQGLTPGQYQRFRRGMTVFNTNLTPADGLGPAFNDISCGNCHSGPLPGGGSVRTVTRFGAAATGGNPFDPLGHLGGSLLQEQAISVDCEEHIPAEANVIAERMTPITFGAGLLEGIDDAELLLLASNQPPGLNGFPHMVPLLENPSAPLRVAKFGWKGVIATTMSFSIDASLGEMGLTTVFLPNETAPNGDPAQLFLCDSVADPEDLPDIDGFTRVDRFTDFQRFLAAPPQTPRAGMSGELLFDSVGCGGCHYTPGFVTQIAPESALSGIPIKPYTDCLLHDMGSLGDQIVQGAATENIMHTRALWGLRARDAFLHDARATGGSFEDNMRATIAEHEGEGAASRAAFLALSVVEQDQLIAFLGSLGQEEFDAEVDNDLDEFDWYFLEPHFTGPGAGTISPDDFPANLCDIDQDGDFDLIEFGLLQRAFTGQIF
jgi:CxxC motif-containing protein (DUF1111 family)